MLIQSQPGTRLRSCPAPRLHSLTHSLTSSRVNTPVPSPSDKGAGHADPIPPMLTTTSWSHGLNALLTLALFAALAACGPASSDHAPNLEPGASVAGPGNRSEASGTGKFQDRCRMCPS